MWLRRGKAGAQCILHHAPGDEAVTRGGRFDHLAFAPKIDLAFNFGLFMVEIGIEYEC